MTLSMEGGLRPSGSGSHGLLIASFITSSLITSSACFRVIIDRSLGGKFVEMVQVEHWSLSSQLLQYANNFNPYR